MLINSLSGQKILLVDDEEMLRDILVSELELNGARVESASDVPSALKLISAHEFDLIISDIRMPGLSGIELLKTVREKSHNKPAVMMITGFSSDSLPKLYDLGADAVLRKPFNFELFQETVVHLLSSPPNRWTRQEQRLSLDDKNHIDIDISIGTFANHQKKEVICIGRGGLFFKLNPVELNLCLGQTISFHGLIKNDIQSQFAGQGQVRWLRSQDSEEGPMGAGIEFTYLSEDSMVSLEKIINELKTKSYIPSK